MRRIPHVLCVSSIILLSLGGCNPKYPYRLEDEPEEKTPLKQTIPSSENPSDSSSYMPIDEERALLTGQQTIFEKHWHKQYGPGSLDIDPRDRLAQKVGISSEDRDWLNGKRDRMLVKDKVQNPINLALTTTTNAFNKALKKD